MGQELSNDYGKISISREVIAIIAGLAAVECYGLVGMSSQTLQDGLAELLGRENLSKGVSVKIEKDDVLIDIYIIVEYGVNIMEVANNVLGKVDYTVEKMTGIKPAKININVQGVRIGATY
ncbi:MAG: Asp23/Gls24 family envelope stress response protein [Halanaerobiales bacterium]|nr:Asp23/Gls24 family envelope stress response protein [Halanaerobiales bacterium]